jgi:hypothetical protein
MTRREQISLYLKERNIPITSLEANSIIEGIKWADEHPYLSEEEQVGMGGLGMMWQQQALIKKACEWLNNNAKNYTIDGGLAIESLIYSFKKAMEE